VYGKVLECKDSKYEGISVAVKVVRNQPAYRAAAQREIRVLRHLQGKRGLVRILRDFEFRGHICISMEMCGQNVKEAMDQGRKFSLKEVQGMGKQIIDAVKTMHDCGIIHTDIKTDNILLAGENSEGMPTVVLADLGSATYRKEWHPDQIGTKEYRAPEAVLQVGWHDAVDLWATGCVLVELLVGRMLFRFEEEQTYLPLLELTLGKPLPAGMVKRAWEKRNQHNAKLIKLNNKNQIALSRPVGRDLKMLDEFDGCSQSLDALVPDGPFRILIRSMLDPHPGQRPTPQRCLESKFFQMNCDAGEDELGSSMGEYSVASTMSAMDLEEVAAACRMKEEREEPGQFFSPKNVASPYKSHSATAQMAIPSSATDRISVNALDL
jgi:serine/threonine protein kinase